MEREQFQKSVEYIGDRDKSLVSLFRDGYDSWECRASLGRHLASRTFGQREAAIKILKTVVDVDVADEFTICTHMTDLEDKAWAMQELGVCIWNHSRNAQEALHYTDIALNLAESTNREYCFITRGEIWSNRLLFLKKLNLKEDALQEADEKIALVQQGKVRIQSYAYYGYVFKARHKAECGDIEEALQYLKQAFDYYPREYWTLGEVEKVWRNRDNDMQGTFEYMIELAERNWCWGDWWKESVEVEEKV